jgi:uncharacterized protein
MNRSHLTLIFVLAAVLVMSPVAHGASSDLVVSEVYAGGGNAGASFTNDYVELFNRGTTTVDLSGWSIQYATSTGTTWSATALFGTLAPGRRYLVQFASAAAIGAALPTPDATGTTNLAASGGKVALVQDSAPLACGSSPGSCSAIAAVHDLVGYGTATDYEGTAAAPALDNTTAAARAGGGCTDTDSNAVDFAAGAGTPQNTSAAAAPCSGGGSPSPTTQAASVGLDLQSSISLTLSKASVSFGSVAAGSKPASVAEQVTVTSNDAAGYALSVRRAVFTPVDLPLGIAATAPAGAQLGAGLGAGAIVGIPTATDLLLGTAAAVSAVGGDIWPTSLGFAAALPALAPGHYSSSVVYTVIAA